MHTSESAKSEKDDKVEEIQNNRDINNKSAQGSSASPETTSRSLRSLGSSADRKNKSVVLKVKQAGLFEKQEEKKMRKGAGSNFMVKMTTMHVKSRKTRAKLKDWRSQLQMKAGKPDTGHHFTLCQIIKSLKRPCDRRNEDDFSLIVPFIKESRVNEPRQGFGMFKSAIDLENVRRECLERDAVNMSDLMDMHCDHNPVGAGAMVSATTHDARLHEMRSALNERKGVFNKTELKMLAREFTHEKR